MAGEKIAINAAKELAEKLAPAATTAAGEAIVAGARNALPEVAQKLLGIEAAAGNLAGDSLRAEFMQTKSLGVSGGIDTGLLSDKARGYLGRLTPQERENLLSTMSGQHPEDVSEMIEIVGPKLSSRNDFLPALTFGETGAVRVGDVGNTMNASDEFRRALVTGQVTPERLAARSWIATHMPEAIRQPPLSAVLPVEAGTPTVFGEGRYAVGKLHEPLQTEHLETCAAISCVDPIAGKQLLIHAGDWNTAADITNIFKTEGFNLDRSKLSIMIGPRTSSTLENILPAFTDANGAIRPIKVITSPPGMYPASVATYNGEFHLPNTLFLGK
jgi:hypothetical protein